VFLLLLLKTLLKNLLLPPAGPLLLAALGVLLIKRRPALARACLILGIASLWLLSTPMISYALARLAEHYPPMDPSRAANAQAIVILGGGGQRAFAPEYGGAAAGPILLERLTYGAYIARQTGLPVLVTGFWIEAEAMRATLQRNFGIDARWCDNQAFDTFQNAHNSVRLLKADGVQRIILVTHATHMWRAANEFTEAGVEVIPAPVGVIADHEPGLLSYLPSADALLRSYSATNELVGEPVRAFLAATHLRRQ
jgi:uncharacterized SAM-binding protein YcdF (DUF218 family)